MLLNENIELTGTEYPKKCLLLSNMGWKFSLNKKRSEVKIGCLILVRLVSVLLKNGQWAARQMFRSLLSVQACCEWIFTSPQKGLFMFGLVLKNIINKMPFSNRPVSCFEWAQITHVWWRTRQQRFVLLIPVRLWTLTASATHFTECGIKPCRWNHFHCGSWTETVLRAAQTTVICAKK